jgi:hypothetical protein
MKNKNTAIIKLIISSIVLILIGSGIGIILFRANPQYLIFVPLILIFYTAVGYGFYKEVPLEDQPIIVSRGIGLPLDVRKKLGRLPFYPGFLFLDSINQLKQKK